MINLLKIREDFLKFMTKKTAYATSIANIDVPSFQWSIIDPPSFFFASSKACSKLERASGEANSKTKLLSAEAVVNSSLVGRKVMLKASDCLSDSSLCTDAIRSLITSSRD